ncbi:MAG: VOC family protein [Bryobacteraceae bacterium]
MIVKTTTPAEDEVLVLNESLRGTIAYMPILRRIAPELPVFDLPKSLDYYEGKLGFRTVMAMPEGDYAIVERDGVAIHLFTAGQNNGPGSIHVFTEGLDELYNEFETAGAQIKQGIVRKPWGNRDFRVLDDFGNEIKFTEANND